MPERRHRPDCPGPEICTLDGPGSSADMARARGWGPGTTIEGDEGFGPRRITITALGESRILARGVELPADYESTWTLVSRCWGEVP